MEKLKLVTIVGTRPEIIKLSEVIKNKADDVIAIPMKTGIESLNAAVSISIAMFLIK